MNVSGSKFLFFSNRYALQGSKLYCHTFLFIFKYSFTSERMNIHTLLYFSFILQTFIFKNGNLKGNNESLKMKVCNMNKKYNNVWMSIRLLVNEYLKMNGNVWQWKFRVWSPGLPDPPPPPPLLALVVNPEDSVLKLKVPGNLSNTMVLVTLGYGSWGFWL